MKFAPVSICEPPERLLSERDNCRLIPKEKTMKYMLLIYSDEKAWTEGERGLQLANSHSIRGAKQRHFTTEVALSGRLGRLSRDLNMRYLVMIKYNENGAPPSQDLLDAIARNRQEAMQAGALVEVGGLYPSAVGARIRLSGGSLTITDGPFTETRELVGGYSVYEVKSRQEAIDWTHRFMRLFEEHWPVGECEAEIRQLFEAPAFNPNQVEAPQSR
jgi:hypothetical protein